VAVVHMIYRRKHYESQSKDYEFSRLSMQDHWDAGRADTLRTLHDPRWLGRKRNATGIHVYDLAAPTPTDKTASVGDSGLREHHNRGLLPPPTPKLERT
jgi:NTE family protein